MILCICGWPHHHDVPEKNDSDGRAIHAKSLRIETSGHAGIGIGKLYDVHLHKSQAVKMQVYDVYSLHYSEAMHLLVAILLVAICVVYQILCCTYCNFTQVCIFLFLLLQTTEVMAPATMMMPKPTSTSALARITWRCPSTVRKA